MAPTHVTFTDEQQAIIAHPYERHGRVLAGPGTGKSGTVVAFLERILDEHPELRVRLLTFTRATTAELALKLAHHSHRAITKPSTVHSFALSLLLANPDATTLPRPLRLADPWEAKEVVGKTLARRLRTTPTQVGRLFRELASNWESLGTDEDNRIDASLRSRFLGAWQEHRRIYGYTTISELPYALLMALRSHDDLDGLDFNILVVDEYQDLNACDLEVLRHLADRGVSVLGVGDDDQSIYGFRKAHPAGIRRFPDDYPGSLDYPLSVTHRCGRRIVEWANHVIGGDPDRGVVKAPLTPSESAPDGEVALLAFPGQVSESRGVAHLVSRLIEREGLAPSDILVLLRSDNAGRFSGPIRAELDTLGVPVFDAESVPRLFSVRETRRVLALLRILVDEHDSMSWATLMELTPGIGPTVIDALYDLARRSSCSYSEALLSQYADGFPALRASTRPKVSNLVGETLRQRGAVECPPETPADGWGHWIASQIESHPDIFGTVAEEFRGVLRAVDELCEEDTSLSRFLAALQPTAKDQAVSKGEGVRIMSMASSKGLTVEATVIPALEDTIVPLGSADISEERRLLYVALTRARRFVFGTWARRRTGPTARTGTERVVERRSTSRFLEGGPVGSRDGDSFLIERWP